MVPGRRPLHALCCYAAAALLLGCGATVVPPASPLQPTAIYLCDYGVHSSLLLPIDGRGNDSSHFVEYLYGDYNWAALDHTAWYDAIGAAFFSRQSTLGRRFVTTLPGETQPVPDPAPQRELRLIVSAQNCQTVLRQLDARWQAHRATATTPPDEAFVYVIDDEPYSWLHDCNHQTAALLRQMGCDVHGPAMLSDFSVAQPSKR